MSPLHNIHSLIPRPENDFGPENRPEESTPRWVEKPFEGQEYAFEPVLFPGRPGLKHLRIRVYCATVERTKKQRRAPSKRKAS